MTPSGRRLAREFGDRVLWGLVVHPGRRIEEPAPRTLAVPDVVLLQ